MQVSQYLGYIWYVIYPKYWDNFNTSLLCQPQRLSLMGVRPVIRRSRVGSVLGLATFFREDWSWNIFWSHSLHSADSRRTVVSFWQKNTALRTKPTHENMWSGKLTSNMTLIAFTYRAVKLQTNQNLLLYISYNLNNPFFHLVMCLKTWNKQFHRFCISHINPCPAEKN